MQKRLNIFFLIFTLSGFSGLIYESIWTHYLKLFLGHAAYAQALVLAIFMGGMALGSALCSRYSLRWKNLLVGYAIAEGLIGLFALVFHDAFDLTVRHSYATIIPQLGSTAANAYKWALSVLLILPQSALLGMTFPLMSAGIMRLSPQNPGRTISLLYFTNSLGAAVGVLVSGFLLIRLVGLPWTIRLAGLINMALAVTVWALSKGPRRESSGGELAEEGPSRRRMGGLYGLFLFASLTTGAASFIYEIGWIRMLSLVLGSSTHAFELMLSAFIAGLAFGGLWIQRRIDRMAAPSRALSFVQIVMGLLALTTLPLYGRTFDVMQWLVTTLPKTDTGYLLFNLSSNAIALAVMLPTTFCAGMTLPLITYTLLRRGAGERSIGAVYASNTVGAILGVFFAIHVGMPVLGLKGSIIFGAGLDIALGVLLAWSAADFASKRLPAIMTALCLCALAAAMGGVHFDFYKMSSGVYRNGSFITPGNSTLLYFKDGKTATVSVAQLESGNRFISTNGKEDAGINMNPDPAVRENPDEDTMILLGVIPMALNPQATSAAAIGFGSGLTTHTLLSNPRLRKVDTVEIERAMVEAANQFRPRVELAYTDPRGAVHIDDAKTFFSVHHNHYDIIVSEPSNPWVSGVAGLFSTEFYRLINRHLTDDGIFVQWVQLYEINTDLVISVLKAVSSNFSDYVVYGTDDADIVIVARRSGTLPGIDPRLLTLPELSPSLARIRVKGVQDIEIRRIGDKKSLRTLLESSPIPANSDYYPVLDQNAARTRFLKANAQDLSAISRNLLPAPELLSGPEPAWTVTDISPSLFFSKTQTAYEATVFRDYYRHGKFELRQGDIPEEDKQEAVRMKQLFYDCRSLTSQNERMASLFNTSIKMVAYLTPRELDAVWRTLESGPCARSLSATERNWLSLFKAVGKRDAQAMVSAAHIILDGGQPLPRQMLQYGVAAGMVGALGQGDREGAYRFWSAHGSGLLDTTDGPHLLFRMLAAGSALSPQP
jgi:predicted membrane-bound spermidine synthase